MTTVTFSTFCHSGDAHQLHRSGQLKKQVESNDYNFDQVIVIHQRCNPFVYENPSFEDCDFPLDIYTIDDFDLLLRMFSIDKRKQYVSPTDKAHRWEYHVVNHLAAISRCFTDYIVFADNDCWIIRQPDSWVQLGIEILEQNPDIFIVSPNDGEPERKTLRMSQQMFMARTKEFRNADFNQPGFDGDVHIEGGPFPEYWALLEGRMEIFCKSVGKYRYVLGPEYRYWHHGRLNESGHFETDYSKY